MASTKTKKPRPNKTTSANKSAKTKKSTQPTPSNPPKSSMPANGWASKPERAPSDVAGRRYWLFKSEPESYGFEQFQRDGRTFWHGVRNYQARNLLRDEIRVDDGVLFYHSSADPTAIVGIARVVKAGYPDATAFEPNSDYYDPGSDPQSPTWFVVDIACVAALAAPLTRESCKGEPALRDMVLLQRGSRLSVQPVSADEWRTILRLGGGKETW